jgi:hypothetical protein
MAHANNSNNSGGSSTPAYQRNYPPVYADVNASISLLFQDVLDGAMDRHAANTAGTTLGSRTQQSSGSQSPGNLHRHNQQPSGSQLPAGNHQQSFTTHQSSTTNSTKTKPKSTGASGSPTSSTGSSPASQSQSTPTCEWVQGNSSFRFPIDRWGWGWTKQSRSQTRHWICRDWTHRGW